MFYKALILQGEIRCWSLLGFKGLKVWKRIRYLPAPCDYRWREDSLGEIQLQWPRSKKQNKNKLWRKKKKNSAGSGTSSLERCTLTMIPEISARGSLIPAEPSTSPLRLNILSSHDSQRGRELSAPKPYVTVPLQARSKLPVLYITMNRKNIYIDGMVVFSSMWCAFT